MRSYPELYPLYTNRIEVSMLQRQPRPPAAPQRQVISGGRRHARAGPVVAPPTPSDRVQLTIACRLHRVNGNTGDLFGSATRPGSCCDPTPAPHLLNPLPLPAHND
jgi:hypothetical protein